MALFNKISPFASNFKLYEIASIYFVENLKSNFGSKITFIKSNEKNPKKRTSNTENNKLYLKIY